MRANGRGFSGCHLPDFQPAPTPSASQALAPVGRAWVPVAEAFALPMRSGALGAVQSWPPHALGRGVRGLGRLPACVGRPPHSNGACGLSRAALRALRTSCKTPASWLGISGGLVRKNHVYERKAWRAVPAIGAPEFQPAPLCVMRQGLPGLGGRSSCLSTAAKSAVMTSNPLP